MGVTPGTRIGAYELTSQLDQREIGVVFRARDTQLLRDVAIRLLPDSFADDPARFSRVQRAVQFLASLNHPNIARIYGLETMGNVECVVMEFVEGETLEHRLKNGPIPVEQALTIANQVADALAAAHNRGIVHRDLTPANIKLASNGPVKVLDFGLAKILESRRPERDLSNAPTKVTGSIVDGLAGTPAYMSPEQARGRDVDARSDIWAFGCVLYEMLVGRHPFQSESIVETLANIVTSEPDFNSLPAGTPHSLRMFLEACLSKDPQRRLQHIGDMRLFLDERFFTQDDRAANRIIERGNSDRSKLVAVIGMVVFAAVIAAAFYLRSVPQAVPPQMLFELVLPNIVGVPLISPDGQRIAYVAQPSGDSRAVWIRSINSEAVQKLPRTDNAGNLMMWSPDSRYVAFTADGKLKKVDIDGGSVDVITELNGPVRGYGWNREGVIIAGVDGVIARVSDQGGMFEPVTQLDISRKEQFHGPCALLPDGHHFLYAVSSLKPENSGLFVGSLDSAASQRILPATDPVSGLAYYSGYLLLLSQRLGPVTDGRISGFGAEPTGTLTAQRFDAKRFTVGGQPLPIAEVESLFSISDTGVLVYRNGVAAPTMKQLLWFDRDGRQLGQVGANANYGNVDLSPTADRVAVDINTNGNRDVWVIDIGRGVSSRITFDPGADWSSSWSPDGTKLIFGATRRTGTHMYEKSSSGAGTEKLLFAGDKIEIPVSWSHDGKHVAFSRARQGGTPVYDTWVLDMSSNEPKATPFVESPFDKVQARISPDGHWIAYSTNDSGTYQIVVQSFPDPNGGKWQITSQGGVEPKWRHDGRELYYLAFDGKLMAVPVKGDRTFEAGTPTPLFETPLAVSRTFASRDRRYDVAPDGKFLMAVPTGNNGPPPAEVVVNWVAALAGKN